MVEIVSFRAHARLLTMLGEQLIKNERIALVELVKNSYDADATEVSVDFRGFDGDYQRGAGSSIVVTDNGSGMSRETILDAWLNPATPVKAISKRQKPTTALGRYLQGEKGIGRFASFKLGNQVLLTTRAKGTSAETTLLVDISGLDEGQEDSVREDFYLDEIGAELDQSDPVVFDGSEPVRADHGLQLEIRGLRSRWSKRLVDEAFSDLERMRPLMWSGASPRDDDFSISFLRDGTSLELDRERAEEADAILEHAVLRVTDGHFDPQARVFRMRINDAPTELRLDDQDVKGLRVYRNWLAQRGGVSDPQCGPFEFTFFVFDLNANAPDKFKVGDYEQRFLRNHRIYLYRDDIRVYPYGDPGDDWLHIDAIRGTIAARAVFTNDQTIGVVRITQAGNPDLQDKTNREGLLEAGEAPDDFVAMLQTLLSYLRAKPYEQYLAANRRVHERNLQTKRVDEYVEAIRHTRQLPEAARARLDQLQDAVHAERALSQLQLSRTEQLAGVGLSVETASHDLIAAGGESLRLANKIVAELKLLDLLREPVYSLAVALVRQLEFVEDRFQDVQGLFVSSRQKSGPLDVIRLSKRVRAMYEGLHSQRGIEFDIDEDAALVAVTTEAAVLQCIINLVDNATFWLTQAKAEPRRIRAYSDGPSLVITDNGPGVKEQDEPFIFEPFYSGKGDTGKGLGLFIARQNGNRSGFTIELRNRPQVKDFPGATFVVTFSEVK